ncbi:type IV pilus modification protein PilV [Steroidobacter cummioxidans]|uniref:type IV pilus modification protein PilV n=1 Tax=Steroidobacter cummioxidans TaxID=1803913 RepID=UPI0019D46F12|nr:type IV pilus modification protein PilV [Steroidobacter cummioxidans]
MMSLQLRSPANQRGFTLVEILVTVVLISVGLLGVAALQLTTLRGNQDAYVRSQASVLAGDILDRMRVNPFDFRANGYSVDFNGEKG